MSCEVELKSCPFCGIKEDEENISKTIYGDYYFIHRCVIIGKPIEMISFSIDDLKARWNTRTPNKPAEVDLEGLKKKVPYPHATDKAEIRENGEVIGWNDCIDYLASSGHLATGKGGETRTEKTAEPCGDRANERGEVVPGAMRCAKCNFRLQRNKMYMQSGTIGPGDSNTEPCPNGCGPLWPVTWKEDALEGDKHIERLMNEIAALKHTPQPDPIKEAYENGRLKMRNDLTGEMQTVQPSPQSDMVAVPREVLRTVLDVLQIDPDPPDYIGARYREAYKLLQPYTKGDGDA